MPSDLSDDQVSEKHRKSPLWAKISLVLGAVIVVVSGSTFAVAKVAEKKVNEAIPEHKLADAAEAPVQHVDIKGAKNILLAGLDTRPSWTDSHLPSHTDSIIILHIAADHKQAYMVSIPRDSRVVIPSYDNGKYKNAEHSDKINAAFAFGSMGLDGDQAIEQGMTLLTKTIKQDFGITPDAEAVINYDGFTDLLAQIKQVCLFVDENVTSIHVGHTKDGKFAIPFATTPDGTDATPNYVDGQKVIPNVYKIGNQCLGPTEALDFARQRDKLSPLDDGDYGRQRHQQQLLKAILKTAVKQGLNSPTKLPGILTAIGKALTVFQQGISVEDWAFGMRNVNPDTIISLKTNGGEYNPKTINGTDYELLSADTLAMIKAAKNDTLDAFVRTHPTWVAKS